MLNTILLESNNVSEVIETRCEVLTMVTVEIVAFRDVMPYGGMNCLEEFAISMFLPEE
jgi:hypothetical protein